MTPLPSAKELKKRFEYDPKTGVLTWKRRSGPTHEISAHNARFAGKPAGSVIKRGLKRYLMVQCCGSPRYAHRIIFKMMTGREAVIVDHIDGDGLNNRWANLRDATALNNQGNRGKRSDAVGLPKGVGRHGKRFRAYMSQRGRFVSFGCYDTPEEAHAVYCKAAKEYFGEFHRP
jgi:hypothetical protein